MSSRVHSPGSPRHFSASEALPEALRRRIVLLEEATSSAWSQRSDLEGRVASLEREFNSAMRSNAKSFEANAQRVTELAVSVAALPLGRALHDAIDQMRWLEDEWGQSSNERANLQDSISRLDGRTMALEKCVQEAARRVGTAEATMIETSRAHSVRREKDLAEMAACVEKDRLAETLHDRFMDIRALVDSKADRRENMDTVRFAETLQERFQELRTVLEAKADRRDQDRLADALSQSCRDLTSTLRCYRQDLSILEQSSGDQSHRISQCSQDVSMLAIRCSDLESSFAKKSQQLVDLERQWSRRLWGYRENSPSTPRRPRQASTPRDGGAMDRGSPNGAVLSAAPPWKPWPEGGIVTKAHTDQPTDTVPSGWRDRLSHQRAARGDREGLRAEERFSSPGPYSSPGRFDRLA